MDQFAEDEVGFATLSRSHNTISQPVITELKNKFQYEIQDSSEESSTEGDSDETTETGSSSADNSTMGCPSTVAEESDDDNSGIDPEVASIGSAASLMDFSDANKERKVSQALKDNQQVDTMSVCSTGVADIVQRQLDEFSMTLRRQIEKDMEHMLAKRLNGDAVSQISFNPSLGSRKKSGRHKSEEGTKRKRPRKKQHYVSDDELFEIPVAEVDPNAPRPEGESSKVVCGPEFEEVDGQARSIEEALHKHGTMIGKAPAFTVLDNNGKVTQTVSYAKLLSRTQKIAFGLLAKFCNKDRLNDTGSLKKGDIFLKKGDRVALIYPSQDPSAFAAAFFACLFANLVPVPVEAPISNAEPGSQQLGFLLGQCGVQVALTSEAGYKALPKDPNDHKIVQLKGWPKLFWFTTDKCAKPPKDWIPPSRQSPSATAYIEYMTARNSDVMGVTVTRAALITNTKAVAQTTGYNYEKSIVSLVDPKREVGLATAILAPVFAGANTIFVPPVLSRNQPAAWLQLITKHKAQFAITSSRAMLNALKVSQMPKDINLACLQMIIVSDGSQPWTVYTCDSFQSSLQTRGLDPAAMCPCAFSPHSLTFAMRRPRRDVGHRGVLSMLALSYSVVKFDEDANLTSLSLQDCGNALPGVNLIILKLDSPMLAKADEIGEICVSSIGCGTGYFNLPGKSEQNFKVIPLDEDGRAVGNHTYVKTGLIGFVNSSGSIFVAGTVGGIIRVAGRRHNSEDLRATVLAVEPPSFVHRLRVAIFSITLLREERIVVVAEQSNNFTDEQSFQWMSHVQQAIESIHQVVVYGILLVPPSGLPKCSDGSINIQETKTKFLSGSLNPSNILMFPYRCVTNLPKPKNPQDLPLPVQMMGMAIKSGAKPVEAAGVPLDVSFDDQDAGKKFEFLSETLRFRAQKTPEHVLFSLLDARGHVAQKFTCSQLHRKAERIAGFTLEKAKLNSGDNVALLYPAGLELISAFYGCLYAGLVPVCIRPPCSENLQAALPTLKMMMECCNIMAVLTTHNVAKLMTSKAGANVVDPKKWPMFIETDDAQNKKKVTIYKPPTPEMIAYLDFSVNSNGLLTGVKMSHSACNGFCRALKSACELYPSRHLALALDPFSGMGFGLWCLAGVYAGHHSILVPTGELDSNPSLWLQAVSQYKVRDSFMSYTVLEHCARELANNIDTLKGKGLDLGSIRTCLLVAEERPKTNLIGTFSTLGSQLGLPSDCISTTFGCRVNIGLCCRGASQAPPSVLHVDLRALRTDRIVTVEKGSPHSVPLMQSGTLLPGCRLTAVSLEKKEQCGPNQLGEIWVSSSYNCSGYYCLSSTTPDPTNDHFNLTLPGSSERWAKTGYLGFISLAPKHTLGDKGGENKEVYILGMTDETLQLRGMRYYPIDIEFTISRVSSRITNSAVFTWQQLLVAVVEYNGPENEAMNVIPQVTSAVAEEHHLIVGVVVIVDPGTLPVNSRGEKQRMHLRDGFLADSLDPIYITYNM